MSSGAAVAVISDCDGSSLQLVGIDVPKIKRLPPVPLHTELLVKVAVVEFAAPSHAQGIAAHEPSDRRGVERADEQLQVDVQLSVMSQPGGKATDGHVCDGVETVEINVEMPLQFALIVGFKLCLVRRKKRSIGIVNQIQAEIRPASVANLVKKLKRTDACVKHALAALGIDVGGFIAWHRGHNFHAMCTKKIAQPFVAIFKEDRQITSINDGFDVRDFSDASDQVAKIRNHLRRSPGEIDRGDICPCQPIENAVNGLATHDFFALRPCVDVAMDAGQVAELAEVKLQNFRPLAPKRQTMISQATGERSRGAMIELRRDYHLLAE